VLGHGADQSQKDEKNSLLESVTGTLGALKRFIAEYDRVKGERDNFERQIASALVENETLRRQIKHAKDHRDHLSKALATLTAQIDTIGTRCIETAKMARAQAYDEPPAAPAKRFSMPGCNQAQQPVEPNTPSNSALPELLRKS